MQIYGIDKKAKMVRSPEYNMNFDIQTGRMERWGKTIDDDPDWCMFGPEIADIEVTTICGGQSIRNTQGIVQQVPCPFCYKSNTPNGKNMSLETFKMIIDKMPHYGGVPFLTQVAFGADARAESNPDLWRMMEYCREKQIVPNITVADISDETADKLVKYCGAVAVSRYEDKNVCYDSVKKLTDRGLEQVNIHIMVADETFEMAKETLWNCLTDPRLEKLGAVVMLSLKKKGRGVGFTQLDTIQFKWLIDFAIDKEVRIGLDSCGAHKFLAAVDNPEKYINNVEPCESTGFSIYCNVDGVITPCSFCDGQPGWEEGIDMHGVKDFMTDVWLNPRVAQWRQKLIAGGRQCPMFDI